MMFLRIASLLCGLLLLSSSVFAYGRSDVIATVEAPFKSDATAAIHDFTADFFQQSRIASLDKIQRGQGEVKIRFASNSRVNRAPLAMFRWEYSAPTEQEIVSDGHTMWVYLPENSQVIESDLSVVDSARADDPATFLTGLGNLSRDFSIHFAIPDVDVEGNPVLELKPRRSSPLITRLLLVVDRRAVQDHTSGRPPEYFPILSSTVFDPNGNSTIIEFNDGRINRGLSSLDFRFMMPPGVDVVRPTGSGLGF
ncbi:MAG: outer membrane lipoprotein carrier protein LolA [Desulfuromonas sp.]|nr:MAG: outer membrane lipoprotein carrier protein LolA [Desulfuromonas sp.]